jgi:hypothetical protein
MRLSLRSSRFAAPATDAASLSTDTRRRRFLFTLGVSTAGAAAATVAALPATAATEVAAVDNDTDAKYRETPHVRDYYRTAKL